MQNNTQFVEVTVYHHE